MKRKYLNLENLKFLVLLFEKKKKDRKGMKFLIVEIETHDLLMHNNA